MAMHEPLLDVLFADGKQETQPAELFDLEDGNSVLLSHGPDAGGGEYALGDDGGHAVEGVVDDPVEHLDEKGKPLQDATVQVVLEARRVWGKQSEAQDLSNLGQVLGRGRVVLLVVCILWVVA